ncbi:hypothetical protein Kisp01_70450 [Kineosporia sp. NBRC 101677]|uniref:hypothetical protein n=1 Tax=Kineosporia sp. NBRC 101677 TaxID=3032197 RepID=UPI0024A02420|nr:hypothetical protein [Kineosporia sp. NBRC 101677]GLY20031.1 hypothetical protein Kisp01_70450 [Kineosporia sp. NBRC 101677]
MNVVSLFIDAPDQLPSTKLVRDRAGALRTLRELYPDLTARVRPEDLVHHLGAQGIKARIEYHDITSMVIPPSVPPCPWGDLFKIDTLLSSERSRRGEFLRPATAFEAALSRSCAQLDGGAGVFGVHRRHGLGTAGRISQIMRANTSASTAPDNGLEYLHYGTRAWDQALMSHDVRYFRVDNLPAEAHVPEVPSDILS